MPVTTPAVKTNLPVKVETKLVPKKKSKKEFKLKDVQAQNVVPWLLLGFAGFALFKVAQNFGLIKSKEEKEQDEKAKKVIKDFMLSACELTPSTGPDALWLGVANGIWGALEKSKVSDNKKKAEELLKKPQNDCDVAKLIDLYGIRTTHFFGLPEFNGTLPGLLGTGELSESALERINADYRNKGIRYKW